MLDAVVVPVVVGVVLTDEVNDVVAEELADVVGDVVADDVIVVVAVDSRQATSVWSIALSMARESMPAATSQFSSSRRYRPRVQVTSAPPTPTVTPSTSNASPASVEEQLDLALRTLYSVLTSSSQITAASIDSGSPSRQPLVSWLSAAACTAHSVDRGTESTLF